LFNIRKTEDHVFGTRPKDDKKKKIEKEDFFMSLFTWIGVIVKQISDPAKILSKILPTANGFFPLSSI
jgi:hypothetical protein